MFGRDVGYYAGPAEVAGCAGCREWLVCYRLHQNESFTFEWAGVWEYLPGYQYNATPRPVFVKRVFAHGVHC